MTTDVAGIEDRPGAGQALQAEIEAAAGQRQRRRDLRPLASLGPFVRAHAADAIAAGVFLLLSTAATLGLTWALRLLIDHGVGGRTTGSVDRYFLLAALIGAALALATAGRFFFITRLGERVVADLRERLYRHVLTLDQAFFLKVRTGEVLSRLTTDLTIVENMVGSSISVALRNILIFVAGFIWLVWLSPGFTGLALLVGVLVILPLFAVGRVVRRLSAHAQSRFADAVAYAGETLDGLDTVQAFGREASAATRFSAAVETAFNASVARIGARAVMTALVMTLLFIGVGFVLWRAVLASLVDPQHFSTGVLAQFIMLAILVGGSAGALGETWGDVQKTAGAMERINEILAARPAIAAPASPKPLPVPPRGEIVFEDVTFAYPGRPDLPALAGFSLHVRPGERVALVGPSGAGKSTVFRLLLRFYDPQSGAVRLDGVNLADADPAEARARIALVAQDAPLFSGSALDNLRFGREGASDDRAARRRDRRRGRGLHRGAAGRVRHPARRARQDPFRRPAPAPRHRPRPGARRADPAARRGHQRPRRRERAAGAARARRRHAGPHHPGDRPPPRHRARRRPHRGHGRGQGGRGRNPRRPGRQSRPLRPPRQAPVRPAGSVGRSLLPLREKVARSAG